MGKLAIVPDLAAVEALSDFDGRTVGATTIKVTNAGDGLSEALKVDPTEFHLNDEVIVVLRTIVAKVEHHAMSPDDDFGSLVRSHTLKATEATIVDRDLVEVQLRQQADRIRKARETAAGVHPIPATDGSDPWEDGDPSASPLYGDDPDADPQA